MHCSPARVSLKPLSFFSEVLQNAEHAYYNEGLQVNPSHPALKLVQFYFFYCIQS